ncbi:MAG: response regulator transcription factor [Syntrophales bacterium]|nr:response regulator transcription factor [Syntrophales bacterium]MDD5233193.1 response regulator transcription factor [Syntrophales bacterium]MDD5533865.1 response regulator transcription factor [Syntrophales bacterium]HPL63157.1 response regulator transcription factor [Syntrophales bacterium]
MNPDRKRILIIEDENHIAEGLRLNLFLKGYDAKIAADGASGLKIWKEWRPGLIVLDIMLPGMDGFSVLRNIRLEDERLPVLILSARSEADDKVKGLAYGVDDYLSKPFNLEEFLLRVERLLKRAAWSSESREGGENSGAPDSIGGIYVFGVNTIDLDRFQAECRQGKVNLTEQEIKLLKLFAAHPGRPLSRSEILELCWGYAPGTPTRTVDNFIVRFRKYFEDDPQNPVHFKSIRGIGYLFNP